MIIHNGLFFILFLIIYLFLKRLNELQSSVAVSGVTTSVRRASALDPEGGKFKMTPYIKAFKSRLELPKSDGVGAESVPSRSGSEVRENRPSSNNSEFISKINKFGEKKSQAKLPPKKE